MIKKLRVSELFVIYLRHGFGELLSAKDMEMEMLYGLASIVTAVGDHTVAIGDACCFGNFGDLFKDFGNNGAVGFVDSVNRGNMFFRNNKNMDRGLRIDVVKGKDLVVFVCFFGRNISRDDLTENTHKLIPSLSFRA